MAEAEAPKKEAQNWKRIAAGVALGAIATFGVYGGAKTLTETPETTPGKPTNSVQADEELYVDPERPVNPENPPSLPSPEASLEGNHISITQEMADGDTEILVDAAYPQNEDMPKYDVAHQLGFLSKMAFCDLRGYPNPELAQHIFHRDNTTPRWEVEDLFKATQYEDTKGQYDRETYCIDPATFDSASSLNALRGDRSILVGQIRMDYDQLVDETSQAYSRQHDYYNIELWHEGNGWKIVGMEEIVDQTTISHDIILNN